MQNSIFIAKLIGPVIAAFGLTMLLNRDAIIEMIDASLRSKAIIIVAGLPTFLVGLAIVNTHNFWASSWPVAITIFGWLAMIGGLMRILFPSTMQAAGAMVFKQRFVLPVASAIWLAFGVYLGYQGYIA